MKNVHFLASNELEENSAVITILNLRAFLGFAEELLENFNLHTVISLPPGVFANVSSSGQGPKTNLLFFEKSRQTKEVWYYELTPPAGVKYTKKSSILDGYTKDAFEKWDKQIVSRVSHQSTSANSSTIRGVTS